MAKKKKAGTLLKLAGYLWVGMCFVYAYAMLNMMSGVGSMGGDGTQKAAYVLGILLLGGIIFVFINGIRAAFKPHIKRLKFYSYFTGAIAILQIVLILVMAELSFSVMKASVWIYVVSGIVLGVSLLALIGIEKR